MPTTIRDSDHELLRLCHELRFCTINHLAALTERHRQALNLRLNQLIAEKYIHRYRFSNPNHKHIYSLGSQGYRHLAYYGNIRLEDVPPRLRTSELKPLFIDHTLLITDIHAALIHAGRSSPKRLVQWREGKELYESVTFFENGKKERLPVCPDAFFQIEGDRKRFAYALEADRGTTTHRTFEAKLKAYWRFLEQNRQINTYGVQWFRIVTITLTPLRADGLRTLARQIVPSKYQRYFTFSSMEQLSPHVSDLMTVKVFRTAKEDKEAGLFG